MLGPVSRTMTEAVAAVIGAMAATVAVTPEFGEAGGTDVILDAPDLGIAGRVLLLVVSAAAAGIIFWALRSSTPDSGTPRMTIEVIAMSTAVGVLAGLGYRIVTARSVGANIGGGLVLLASPIAVRYTATRLHGWGPSRVASVWPSWPRELHDDGRADRTHRRGHQSAAHRAARASRGRLAPGPTARRHLDGGRADRRRRPTAGMPTPIGPTITTCGYSTGAPPSSAPSAGPAATPTSRAASTTTSTPPPPTAARLLPLCAPRSAACGPSRATRSPATKLAASSMSA